MENIPHLKKKYKEEIVPSLMDKFQYTSVMQVPRLLKIVINQGVGQAVADKKLIDNSLQEITAITGQKAIQRVSIKDISNFNIG